MSPILSFIILIISIVLHEVSHGYAANALGDPTARLQGRLTLNPIKHIDPVGSVIVPILTTMLSGFTFGWAKPVPYNPHNLQNRRVGEALIAAAGPASNILIALIFSFIIRIFTSNILGEAIPSAILGFTGVAFVSALIQVSATIVMVNLVLAIFNLVPLPPLDGSKILFSLLPRRFAHIRAVLEMYGPILMFVAVFVIWKGISPLVPWVFNVFTGI